MRLHVDIASVVRPMFLALALALVAGCNMADVTLRDGQQSAADEDWQESLVPGERRTPAEWEPQAAVWLQWPQRWEGAAIQRAFVSIVSVLVEYEQVHLLAANQKTLERGRAALAGVDDTNITWHVVPYDNCWMRDNGPRYVEVDGELVLQNWEFNGWGAAFGGDVEYDRDNRAADTVAELLGLPLERVSLVHERGDLEVNGTDTALVNWSVLSHRNPGMTREEITAGIQQALGVTSVIYAEGFDPLDGTRGHVDGMARFVAVDTIVVGDDGSRLMDDIARQIEEQRPDLKVERFPLHGVVPTLNWLVGDGFVLTGTSGDDAADAAAAEQLGRYFPGREVRFVNVDSLWEAGGGVHCVTNDEPLAQP